MAAPLESAACGKPGGSGKPAKATRGAGPGSELCGAAGCCCWVVSLQDSIAGVPHISPASQLQQALIRHILGYAKDYAQVHN